MKMTILDMTQNILSAMSSDEVDSIVDTVESLQIAEIIKETYYSEFNNIPIPEFNGLIQLDGMSDITKPNYMTVTETIKGISSLRYKDYRNYSRYNEINFVEPEDFISVVAEYQSTTPSTVSVTDPSGFSYYIKNNQVARYYTSFDDNVLVFSSFDNTYETTMHASNSICYGVKVPGWTMEDSFVPLLNDNLFPLLLAESKATAFIDLKQISNSKEEEKARRQRVRMQNDFHRAKKEHYDRDFARHR